MTTKFTNGSLILNWQVTPDRKVVQIANNFFVYLLWRNEAYNLWTPLLPNASPVNNYTSPSATEVIIKAGYLIRSAAVSGNTLALTGDLNATVPIEVIGAPKAVSQVTFNGEPVAVTTTATTGALTGTLAFQSPDLNIPNLATLDWKYLDNLPEIQADYDDSAWTDADLTTTPNSLRNLTTPTSLYVADYGFGPGTTLFRGHFTATGSETHLMLQTQGGSAFASSVFLDSTFIGSWDGNASYTNYNSTFALPAVTAGTAHVFTILNDNQGLEEDGSVSSNHPLVIFSPFTSISLLTPHSSGWPRRQQDPPRNPQLLTYQSTPIRHHLEDPRQPRRRRLRRQDSRPPQRRRPLRRAPRLPPPRTPFRHLAICEPCHGRRPRRRCRPIHNLLLARDPYDLRHSPEHQLWRRQWWSIQGTAFREWIPVRQVLVEYWAAGTVSCSEWGFECQWGELCCDYGLGA